MYALLVETAVAVLLPYINMRFTIFQKKFTLNIDDLLVSVASKVDCKYLLL